MTHLVLWIPLLRLYLQITRTGVDDVTVDAQDRFLSSSISHIFPISIVCQLCILWLYRRLRVKYLPWNHNWSVKELSVSIAWGSHDVSTLFLGESIYCLTFFSHVVCLILFNETKIISSHSQPLHLFLSTAHVRHIFKLSGVTPMSWTLNIWMLQKRITLREWLWTLSLVLGLFIVSNPNHTTAY